MKINQCNTQKSHIIISIVIEKSFDKIQHSFMIKILKKLGIARIFLNLFETIYEKPIINIILTDERMDISPPKIRNKTRMSILVFNCTRVSSQSSRQEKEIKVIQIRKGKVKLSVLADDMLVYRKSYNEILFHVIKK